MTPCANYNRDNRKCFVTKSQDDYLCSLYIYTHGKLHFILSVGRFLVKEFTNFIYLYIRLGGAQGFLRNEFLEALLCYHAKLAASSLSVRFRRFVFLREIYAHVNAVFHASLDTDTIQPPSILKTPV